MYYVRANTRITFVRVRVCVCVCVAAPGVYAHGTPPPGACGRANRTTTTGPTGSVAAAVTVACRR